MKKLLLIGGSSLGLFVATVLGLLAAQGRLNHAGTQGIPVLASFFPAPATGDGDSGRGRPRTAADERGAVSPPTNNTAAGGAARQPATTGRSDGLGKERPLPYRQGESLFKGEPSAGDAEGAARPGEQNGTGGDHAQDDKTPASANAGTATDGTATDGTAADAKRAPPGGSPSETTSDWRAKVDSVLAQGQYRPGRLWTFPQIEAGIGVDELNEILRRAREERGANEREHGALQQQRNELLARERDVADRQEAVLEKLREVEQLRAKLQSEIDEFHATVLLIRQDEVSGLQSVAKTLAAVEAKSAAAIIKKWWETDEGQSRALKIWTVMDAEAANAILAELDVELIRQVLEKRLKVVREQAKAKKS